MQSIWQRKKKQEQEKAASAGSSSSSLSSATTKTRTDPALIRIQRDLHEMQLPSTMKIIFPKKDDLLNFTLTIKPDEGIYINGSFQFTFNIPQTYPHDPPKVKCVPKVYHPNIDLQGNVCLNILREDWKPVLSLTAVITGLQFLFLEPNSDDPLNKEAAEVLRNNRTKFETNAKRAMKGLSVDGEEYDLVV